MNSGYIFFIGLWIIIILLYTHWLDFLWRDKVEGKRRLTILFFLLVAIFQGVYLPITPQVALNATMFIILTLGFVYYYWRYSGGYKLQILAVILFLGLFYAVAYEVFLIDPILMILSPSLLLPLFFTLFLVLTTLNLPHQWIMLFGGGLLGELIHKVFLLERVDFVYIGDAAFRDQLIIAFLMLTATNIVIQVVLKLVRLLLKNRKMSPGRQEG